MDKTKYDRANAYGTEEVIFHPEYKPAPNYDYWDIAIVKLNRTIKFNDIISPICLPTVNDNFYGKKVTTAGW
jgi:hypothetical protein